MRTRTKLGMAGALSCAALVVAVGVGRGDGDTAPAGASSPASEAPTGPYVALGDSYTAGPKIPGQSATPAGCERSDHNYPALVARQLGLSGTEFRDMSCTGATTEDLSAAQKTDDGTNPAQLSALHEDTRLVTLGIGGNDIGFSSMITTCVKAGVRYQVEKLLGGTDDSPCRSSYADGELETRISTAGDKLAAALKEIGHRSPDARVYVVGYPTILPAKGDCTEMGLAPGDVGFLRAQEERLNSELRARAKDAGAAYVDTYTPSAGLDACADADVRWVEPLLPKAPAAAVHPNERGEAGMARAVLDSVRG